MGVRIRKVVKVAVVNLIVFTLVFVSFEGFSSVVLLAHEMYRQKPLAEEFHTRFDEELGWVNLPSVHIDHMYGEGVYLRTNSQSFRNNKDFDRVPPPNKVRVICSGDSFTLGYGVDNDNTWCQLLVSIDDQLETVNMGQGGYGIDQAYLWYERDGTKLDHDIHVFAFITRDFVRMQRDEFLGHGKPLLVLEDGQLATSNVPVPKTSPTELWLTLNQPYLSRLNSVRFLQRLLPQKQNAPQPQSDSQTRDVALEVFRELKRINREKDSISVLVYLPVKRDYMGGASDPWREFLADEATKHDLIFIDLVDAYRNLPNRSLDHLFIAPGAVDFEGATGHYTEEGNTFIAEALYERLSTIPEVAERLGL